MNSYQTTEFKKEGISVKNTIYAASDSGGMEIIMYNENVEFYAVLARPKPGVRFEPGNEYAMDLENAIQKANSEWCGDRIFEILEYKGISVKMVYRALDFIKGNRTLTRYIQKISRILAYDKNWNYKATRKPGTIFTVQLIDNPKNAESNKECKKQTDDELKNRDILIQILDVLKDIQKRLPLN